MEETDETYTVDRFSAGFFDRSNRAELNTIRHPTSTPTEFFAELEEGQVGQTIYASVMQDVPLADVSKIRAGAKVIGHVVAVKPATNTSGATMSLQFDTLVVSRQPMPVVTNLRALASTMAVHEAQLPENGPDRGTSENSWTTDQIGGEVVSRGGGPVANGFRVVGKPAPNGVLVHVSSRPGSECRGSSTEMIGCRHCGYSLPMPAESTTSQA